MPDVERGGAPATGASSRWGWFAGMAGVAALAAFAEFALAPLSARLPSIGAPFMLVGACQALLGFYGPEPRNLIANLAGGGLCAATGILIGQEPLLGSRLLTGCVAIALLADAIVRNSIVAPVATPLAVWGRAWGVAVSAIVGAGLYLSFPWSGLWVVKSLLALALIGQSAVWSTAAVSSRSNEQATRRQ